MYQRNDDCVPTDLGGREGLCQKQLFLGPLSDEQDASLRLHTWLESRTMLGWFLQGFARSCRPPVHREEND